MHCAPTRRTGQSGRTHSTAHGTHSWGCWGGQSQAKKSDVQRVCRALRRSPDDVERPGPLFQGPGLSGSGLSGAIGAQQHLFPGWENSNLSRAGRFASNSPGVYGF